MSFLRGIPPQLTVEEQAALNIIQSHRGLIKMISAYTYKGEAGEKKVLDFADIDFNLHQWMNPTLYRPSRSTYYYAQAGKPLPSVVKKTNLKTGEVHDHHPGQCRHTHHKGVVYTHTLKTATTLVPPEPQYINTIGSDLIGHGWDISTCDLKDEKYTWETDGGTTCAWLSPPPYDPEEGDDEMPPVSSVDAIRTNNNKAVTTKKPITWNEIEACIPKGGPAFMFSPKDTRDLRLLAWDVMLREKKALNLEKNIPVFIIQYDHQDGHGSVFRVYTAEEREHDLKEYHQEHDQHYHHLAATQPVTMSSEQFDQTYRRIVKSEFERLTLKRQRSRPDVNLTMLQEQLLTLPPTDPDDALLHQVANIMNPVTGFFDEHRSKVMLALSSGQKSLAMAKLLSLHYLNQLAFECSPKYRFFVPFRQPCVTLSTTRI